MKKIFENVLFGGILFGSILFFLLSGNLIPVWYIHADFGLYLLLSFGLFLLLVNIIYFAWQILLACQYKPSPAVQDEQLPVCAVVIPAYNEGKQVLQTLMSVLSSSYPQEKLQIITVNDGSNADTWSWIQQAVRESRGRILAVNLPKNTGKRNALYKGFSIASAEILITIDSDSIIHPDTIKEIVFPFISDPRIGGVAGNIRVSNTKDGFIPKMLDVSFVFGFEFLRSAQSMVHSVLCMPGALSAYRKCAVMPHMNEWVNEKFLGKPANIGEDRAITNILMREGYGVVYQNTSVVHTVMPKTYKGLCKMMIRWGRSNVRENINMIKFAFKRFDILDENLVGMQCNLIVQTFWMIAPLVFLGYTGQCLYRDCFRFIAGACTAILFWSAFPAFIYAKRYNKRDSLWSYVYGFFSFFTLFWISPYCVLTVHRSEWLTRRKPYQVVK